MAKKIVTVSLIIIFLAAVSFLMYHFLVVKRENPEAGIRDYLPFGPGAEPINGTEPSSTNGIENGAAENGTLSDTQIDTTPSIEEASALRILSSQPVSGATAYRAGDKTLVRFIKRTNGDIIEIETETWQEKKIAEADISKIYEAHWQNNSSLITRTLKGDLRSIENSYLTIMEDSLSPFHFNKDLSRGDSGTDVRELQKVLNSDPDTQLAISGPGSFGNETSLFSSLTENAVKRFQEKYAEDILEPQGLEGGNGVVDSITREKLNEVSGWKELQESNRLLDIEKRLLSVGNSESSSIKELASSPEGSTVFFLTENSSGTEGVIYNSQTNAATKIFESPLKDWLVSWPSPGRISLTTKPGNGIVGYSYLLNTSTGDLEKILNKKPGLTALVNSNSSKVLYSEIDGNNWSSYVKNIETGEVFELPPDLKILPDKKCTWSEQEINVVFCAIPRSISGTNYPDSWYKGIQSFNDSLWKIDTETGGIEILNNLSAPQVSNIDAVDLFLSPGEEYIFFANKNDLSFWSLELPTGS